MKLTVYAIWNETQKSWWTVGHHLAQEPCSPYLWYKKDQANRQLKRNDTFYGWSADGDKVVIKEFDLVMK